MQLSKQVARTEIIRWIAFKMECLAVIRISMPKSDPRRDPVVYPETKKEKKKQPYTGIWGEYHV